MHYCIHLYTKDFPSDEVIKRSLAPYDEEAFYEAKESDESIQRPLFLCDWYQIGGRYGGRLKLNSTDETENRYEWKYLARYKRAGRLYRSKLLEAVARGIMDPYIPEKIDEEEALPYIGFKDGAIRVDGAWLPDVTNLEELADNCFGVLTDDGTVLVRDVWDESTEKWTIDVPEFDTNAKLVMERCKDDHYLTVIDAHS